jgi:ClpP class serine protease
MPRQERKALIQQIEDARESRVLTYVTSDRTPAGAQIGDDAVRPMYAHLREMGHSKKLDLLIYSRGGAIDVPWRIVTALRQTSDHWNILIPFRANSAATLIALGADQIVLGPQGELGPIDPQLTIQRMVPLPGGGQMPVQEQMSVEDIMGGTL